jgi:hypothetical protein
VCAILHVLVFLTTIPTTFQDVYQDRVGVAGFHYLALGAGIVIGSQTNARLMDRVYKVLKARYGGDGRPEFRLRAYHSWVPLSAQMTHFSLTVANIVPATIFLPIGLLITGWTTQNHVFWLVPDIVSDVTCVLLVGVLRGIYTGRAPRLLGLALLWQCKASRHT